MPLVNWWDVEEYVQYRLPDAARIAASAVAVQSQDDLEVFLGRTLEHGTFTDTKVLYGDDGYVPLDNSPVLTVTSVTIDGNEQSPGSWVIGRSGITLGGYRSPLSFGQATSTITVTYTAGLGTKANKAARGVILQRVARVVAKGEDRTIGAKSVSTEGANYTYDDEGFTDAELKRVRRFRKRTLLV